MLHGMPRDELEAMMEGVFKAADGDGSGILDRKEFAKCLKSSELGLSRKEVNLLMSEAGGLLRTHIRPTLNLLLLRTLRTYV